MSAGEIGLDSRRLVLLLPWTEMEKEHAAEEMAHGHCAACPGRGERAAGCDGRGAVQLQDPRALLPLPAGLGLVFGKGKY